MTTIQYLHGYSKNPFQIGFADEIFALHKTTKELLI